MFDLGFLSWIIVGVIVGLIASAIMKQRYPWWLTLVLGILGAVLGGFLAGLLLPGNANWGFWNPFMWIFSTLGAVIVMAIVGAAGNRQKR